MNEHSIQSSLNRKERDKARNKEAIMDAAVHLFARNGFNETKLEDVAARAEFGKGTIYNYFENKNDLLLSTFEYALGKVTCFLSEQLLNITEPLDRLRLIVKAQFDYYQSNEDFLRVVVANQHVIGQAMQGESGKELQNRFMHLRKLMIDEIQAGIDTGKLKQGSASRYASYISGMVHGQIRSLNHREINIKDVNPDEIVDIFLNGASHA